MIPARRSIKVHELRVGDRLWRPAALTFTVVRTIARSYGETAIGTDTGQIIANQRVRLLVAKDRNEADEWMSAGATP